MEKHNIDHLILTESAVRRIKEVSENNTLRIKVKAGGCSGFQYEYIFENQEPLAQDIVITKDTVTLLVDHLSFQLIKGAKVDFIEELGQSYFSIKNPKAANGCGCGNSFSV